MNFHEDAKTLAARLEGDEQPRIHLLPYAAAELRRLHAVEEAFKEWIEKTQWAQETAKPCELGMHRADVLRWRIEKLTAENQALRATQVELVTALKEIEWSNETIWQSDRARAALAPQTLSANSHEIQAPPATPEQRKRLADSMRQVFGGVALEQPEQEAENEQLRQQNISLDAECARLEAINAELAEALRNLLNAKDYDQLLPARRASRAALAKVEAA